ncbi:hypothetical protein ACX0GZ_12475 [Sphingomonas aestuarii]
MSFHGAIALPANLSSGPAGLVAALQQILIVTGGWQPPHQTKSPLRSLIASCERDSFDERQLLKQARKSGASLIAVRERDSYGLFADIAYNADGFWLWHRNLELWLNGEDGCCWFVPEDPCATGMHWTVVNGALFADDLPPFICGEGRMHGVDAGTRLVRQLIGGM